MTVQFIEPLGPMQGKSTLRVDVAPTSPEQIIRKRIRELETTLGKLEADGNATAGAISVLIETLEQIEGKPYKP